MQLEGVIAALTTPFAGDGSVDRAHLRSNVEKYNSTALSGYVAVGSTGEAAFLSLEEAELVWATVIEHAAASKIVIAGTGAEGTAETIDRTRRAAALGYKMALVRTPSYYKPMLTSEVIYEHYRRVADASPIPILIYSIPQFTGVTVAPETVARLAEHKNIAGIKDSSGIVERAAETVRLTPKDFTVLVGSPAILADAMEVGARGGIIALRVAVAGLVRAHLFAFQRGRRRGRDSRTGKSEARVKANRQRAGHPGHEIRGGSSRLLRWRPAPSAASSDCRAGARGGRNPRFAEGVRSTTAGAIARLESFC